MLTADDEEQRLIRIADVRKLVPVSERTLYRMIDRGEFPKPRKLGGLLVWPLSKVREWIEAGGEEDELI